MAKTEKGVGTVGSGTKQGHVAVTAVDGPQPHLLPSEGEVSLVSGEMRK